MTEQRANVAQGETMGPEQVPTTAGDQDQARRDPREDGPLQPDPDEASDEFGTSPDAAYGQRAGQADATGNQPGGPGTPREGLRPV